jgi:hypothetical protein
MGAVYLLLAGDIPDIKTGLLNTMSYIFLGIAAMQSILAMVLFFRFASASDANKRQRVRKWLLNVCSSLIIIIALIGLFQALVYNYGGLAKQDDKDDEFYESEVDETVNIDGKDIKPAPAGVTLKYGLTMKLYKMTTKGILGMDGVIPGSGFDPYNTATTGANNNKYAGYLPLVLVSTNPEYNLSEWTIKWKQDSGLEKGSLSNHYDFYEGTGDTNKIMLHSNNMDKQNPNDLKKNIMCTLTKGSKKETFYYTIYINFLEGSPPYTQEQLTGLGGNKSYYNDFYNEYPY